MITIVLNGSNKQLDSGTSVTQLLKNLDLSEKRLAVEINQQIITRSDFDNLTLNEQDQVEIVQAIGGGSPTNRIISSAFRTNSALPRNIRAGQ